MSSSDGKSRKDQKQSQTNVGKLNTGLRPSLSAMQGESYTTAGSGLEYHSFSTDHFAKPAHARQYMQDTGLTSETDTEQSWGTQDNHSVYRSRRGSIGGYVERDDGSVDTWRLSSHATSQALKKRTRNSGLAAYEQTKAELEAPSRNSRNSETSVNTVISDFGKVSHNQSKGGFSFDEATHASGVSGKGLHSSVSTSDKDEMFGYSTQSMKDRGKTPSPSATYHSEPMALHGHDIARRFMDLGDLSETSDMVGIMESNPNQICAQCAPMISQRVGTNSYVSGNPGKPFNGQKTGLLSSDDVVSSKGKQLGRADVERSEPSIGLDDDENNNEVLAIYDYHGKPSKHSGKRRQLKSSVTPRGNDPYFGNGGGSDGMSDSDASNSNTTSRRSLRSSSTHSMDTRSSSTRFSGGDGNDMMSIDGGSSSASDKPSFQMAKRSSNPFLSGGDSTLTDGGSNSFTQTSSSTMDIESPSHNYNTRSTTKRKFDTMMTPSPGSSTGDSLLSSSSLGNHSGQGSSLGGSSSLGGGSTLGSGSSSNSNTGESSSSVKSSFKAPDGSRLTKRSKR